jgi:putative transposase
MRREGLSGAVRGRHKVRTTVADPSHPRAPDRLRRDFTAPAPNRVWVADFTEVVTWAGIGYVAFIVDIYSRAVVGWAAAASKAAPLVVAALKMAVWRRDHDGHAVQKGLVHHSDAGSPGPGRRRRPARPNCRRQSAGPRRCRRAAEHPGSVRTR